MISLSFARVKERDYHNTRDRICEIIRKLYVEHIYVRDSERLTQAEKVYYDRMLGEELKDNDITSALHQLSDFLYRFYEKK